MYERFFGFNERPFELSPNPRYLFLTDRNREALGTLIYGLSSPRGIIVMTGEAGTGKTTMLTAAIAEVGSNPLIAYLSNPTLRRAEFFELLSTQLGLPDEVAVSKARFLQAATSLLDKRAAGGLVTALVIDEAHSLPTRLLEEVRLLANIEKPDRKLFSVILVGQPELADRLNDPALRQLKQRVALRCALMPLTLRESAAYIAKRIGLAGGRAQVFTRDAVLAVYEYSGGIPRTINVLCENALVSAFARQESLVTQLVVSEVARDFDLQPTAGQVTQPVDASNAHEGLPPQVRVRVSADEMTQSPLNGYVPAADPTPPSAQLTVRRRRRSFWQALRFWNRWTIDTARGDDEAR